MTTNRNASKKTVAKTRHKGMPVISLSGNPPQAKQTWWSQRFIQVLESFKMGNRLARGKAYAQESKVVKIGLSSGIVTSTVQGSKKAHYKVSIQLEPLSDTAWRQVMQNMTNKAIYAVEMLQDQMPDDIEEVFSAARVSLFPSKLEDLESKCDCPDWSNPCKHIAATYYILAEHFDLDPFLIFVWRGRLKTQIIEFLRNYWKQCKPNANSFGSSSRFIVDEDRLGVYWKGETDLSEIIQLDPFSKAVPDSVIKRLGPSPVQLDDKDLAEVLAESYLVTSNETRAWVMSKALGQKLAVV